MAKSSSGGDDLEIYVKNGEYPGAINDQDGSFEKPFYDLRDAIRYS